MPPRKEPICEPDFNGEILDGLKPPRLITPLDKELKCRAVVVRVVPELVGTLDGINLLAKTGVWKIPDWGREPKVNRHVLSVAEDLKECNHLSSTLVLGVYDNTIWRIDGNHRLLGFLLSGIPNMLAHCMVHYCDGHKDMYRIYKIYQRHLRTPTKDDNLKGLAETRDPLQTIKNRCKFVTYETVNDTESRRIRMSAVIRAWYDSVPYIPKHIRANIEEQAVKIEETEARKIVEFLLACKEGLSIQVPFLWKPINITLLMWLYRRLVWGEIDVESEDVEYSRLTKDEFILGMLGLQTNNYYGTLGTRELERDRFGAYTSLMSYFKKSLHSMGVKRRLTLPIKPKWPPDPTEDRKRR